MSILVVDINALHALRAQCATLRDAFGGGDKVVRHTINAVGPAHITDVLRDFESHWEDGHAKVRKHLDGLLKRVDAAIRQYEHSEHDLRRQLEEPR